jgi:predicted SprT family Zn-dependent metalloprotease
MKDADIELYVVEQAQRIGIDAPTVTYRKMKRFFGVAHLYSWTINLNRSWVHRAHDVLVKDLILHELIHLKNFWYHGTGNHDKQFHAYCNQYGCHGNSAWSKKDRKEIISKSKSKDIK